MSQVPELSYAPSLPDEIIQAALNGNLILFIGAGISRLLDLPSWSGLADKIMEDLRKKEFLDYSEIQQLKTLDAKQRLSIAELIASDKYDIRNQIKSYLSDASEADSIYKALNDIGSSCVTTNYDKLLSPRFNETKDGSTTPRSSNRLSDPEQFLPNRLNEPGTVIHLHGSIKNPETMIITTKDYLEHYDKDNVRVLLKHLFSNHVVLFLGYGLEEAEILEHILRWGEAQKARERRKFTLQGFFRSEQPLYENLYKYYESSFGIHLIGFERDKEDYQAQERIIKSWAERIEIKKRPLAHYVKAMNEVLGSE